MSIDPADLQPAVDALTQAASNLTAAAGVRQAAIDSDNADIDQRQAQIDADRADIATQQVALNLDQQGVANIQVAISAIQALITPPDSPPSGN